MENKYIIPFQYNKKYKKNIIIDIITNEDLKQTEKVFLSYFVERLNISYIKQNNLFCIFTKKYLMKTLNLSKNTISSIYRSLVEKNIVDIKRENNNTNKFYLNDTKIWYGKS
jgi:DNA-binding MarR family transcriptional regulator